jgi:hypothetical protein
MAGGALAGHLYFASPGRIVSHMTWRQIDRGSVQFRSLIALAILTVSVTSPAPADPRDETLAGISRCAGISDDRTFLDCIYGAAQPMRARLGLPPAPPSQTALVPPSPGRPGSSQGIVSSRTNIPPANHPQPGDRGLFSQIFGGSAPALHMASYTFDSHGMFTVTLSDGEVWKQVASDTNYANWRGPAADYIVALVATSGGTKMDVKGEPGPYSVQRLR